VNAKDPRPAPRAENSPNASALVVRIVNRGPLAAAEESRPGAGEVRATRCAIAGTRGEGHSRGPVAPAIFERILGVTYKRDIDDVRESPALDIMLLLKRRGARITFSDPYVPSLELDGEQLASEQVRAVANADCTVIVTNRSAFPYDTIARQATLKGIALDNIVRL
jgi:hypothetical protein